MLLQLTPNQISEHWDEIKEHLLYALLPTMEITEDALNNIFKSLLSGDSQAWVIVGDEKPPKIYAMAVTVVSYEVATNTKNLLIYSLSSYRLIPDALWKGALKDIKDYAKGAGCYKVIAYTRVDRIVSVAKSLGGDVRTRLISWEV